MVYSYKYLVVEALKPYERVPWLGSLRNFKVKIKRSGLKTPKWLAKNEGTPRYDPTFDEQDKIKSIHHLTPQHHQKLSTHTYTPQTSITRHYNINIFKHPLLPQNPKTPIQEREDSMSDFPK
jgi:hypothetical protein